MSGEKRDLHVGGYHLTEVLGSGGMGTVFRAVVEAEDKPMPRGAVVAVKLLHSGEALQYGPYAIRTKHTFDIAIRVLERAGWAQSVAGGAEIDGKQRRRVWDIR